MGKSIGQQGLLNSQIQISTAACQKLVIIYKSCGELFLFTLPVQVFRQQKNQLLLIQRSRPWRDSQEPKTTKKIQFSRGLFQKIPFLCFFLHKSWIWRTLGHVMNIFFLLTFSYAMFQKNTFGQKKISNFMHRFKSAILAIFQFFQKQSARFSVV